MAKGNYIEAVEIIRRLEGGMTRPFLCRASNGKHYVARQSSICIKIILLEGKPDRSHPLKGEVASLTLLAIDYYARMIKCTEIEVQDPEPLAIPWYQELGFDYSADGRLVIQVNA
ncbi:HipA family kinase [uncultured Pseudomonas sp.]|uniref:HipA family kinase n=1 Tax=uncultured Pseudomonas sp. TaxID=114707 RepID=UPI0030D76B28|tara:strand:- start:4785 stop:5129 length:345 start_codon:yes stop_codon:yes gene_type:complete